jgi:hypothetical protein
MSPCTGYNRNPDRDLAIPTTRIMIAGDSSYDLTDGVSAFAEINYGQAETDSSFEAHPFQSQAAGSLFGGGPGVEGLQATIPISNPFIPPTLLAALDGSEEITLVAALSLLGPAARCREQPSDRAWCSWIEWGSRFHRRLRFRLALGSFLRIWSHVAG